jgi:2'-5' RNA ligase
VDPYPEPYWHATVKGLGFLVEAPSLWDELSPARLAELAELARPVIESTPPFELRLGRPGAFAEVVIMEVLDGGAIRSLNMRLLEAVPGLLRGPFDGAIFLPHVSIARFSSQEGLGELKETLSRLRSSAHPEACPEPGRRALEGPEPSFEVREVQLISAHLSSAAPTFGLVGAYGLGG